MKEALHPDYVNGDYSRCFVEKFFADSTAATPIDKVLHLDTEIMLVDDPVKRVDNMTMAWGLEARVPFLDHEVVELAARVPSELKVRNGGKHILKDKSRDIVPSEIIDPPERLLPGAGACAICVARFLDFVRDVLNEPVARQRDIFNSHTWTACSPTGRRTNPQGHSKLWQVAVLEACFKVTTSIEMSTANASQTSDLQHRRDRGRM